MRAAHRIVALAVLPWTVGVAVPSAQESRYEHRVVVSTTSLDREQDVEGSLERNVNQLAAAGFEVAAFVGGDAPVLDRLLDRKPYVAGRVDHTGQVFVIMTRAVGRLSVAREYRLLHTRTHIGVDAIIARIGQDGFRLTVTETEGASFHAAFERTPSGPHVEYRVLNNKGRTSWMQQIQQDGAMLARLTRAVPMALDSAIVELGPPASTPGALEWMSSKDYNFTGQESALQSKAKAGFRVQLVRVRDTNIDMLLVRPAGWDGTAATYDLDDGPWGMPCGRGVIVGADVFPDGDTYCAAEQPAGPVANRGFDLRVREEAAAAGRLLFRAPDCGGRARLASARPANPRLVAASQFERELNARTDAGFRVARALASVDPSGTTRVVVFTTNAPAMSASGGSMASAVPRTLTADRDEPNQALTTRREDELTAALKDDASLADADLWVEVRGANRSVRLLGCATTPTDRTRAETVLRRLLVSTPFADYRVRNDVIIDRWR